MLARNRHSLPSVVKITLALLSLAAFLVVVGIFNQSLRWDIFGPRVESALWGLFGSCLALAGIGVAMTFVLGIREIAEAFQALIASGESGPEPGLPPSRFRYAVAGLLSLMVVVVLALAMANHRVQVHRSQVFARLADEQVKAFAPRFQEIVILPRPVKRGVPPHDLHHILSSLRGLSFVREVSLFAFDPETPGALWKYCPGYENPSKHGYEKILVAKESDKAIRDFLSRPSTTLELLNGDRRFVRYQPIVGRKGAAVAVLEIVGNSRENFREYFLGS